jgi:hypothetical protein
VAGGQLAATSCYFADGLPFAQFRAARVPVDRAGRIREDHEGASVLLSSQADGPGLGDWLRVTLCPAAWTEGMAGARRRAPALRA